ncbi:MAG: hypothetical protein GY948_14610 [Alphaproteobacteria bacterium]|nr:hypothetical protein [Alphaproteobacteria bacterium]
MRARPWCLRVGAWAAFLFAAAGASAPTSAEAADISQNSAIECQVTDGRGSINFGRSKHLGEAAGTQRFSPWVLAQDGVNLRDRIGLFWGPSASPAKSLRVAIDGPVSKPTQLISTIKETLVAVAVTSDQHTTRSWLITINFPQETVVVVGTSSGAVAVKAQVMVLSCTFNTQLAGKSAADSWRR